MHFDYERSRRRHHHHRRTIWFVHQNCRSAKTTKATTTTTTTTTTAKEDSTYIPRGNSGCFGGEYDSHSCKVNDSYRFEVNRDTTNSDIVKGDHCYIPGQKYYNEARDSGKTHKLFFVDNHKFNSRTAQKEYSAKMGRPKNKKSLEEEGRYNYTLIGPVLAFILAPMTYKLTKFLLGLDSLLGNFVAASITFLLSLLLITLIRIYIIYNNCQKYSGSINTRKNSLESSRSTSSLFSFLAAPSWIFYGNQHDNNQTDQNNNNINLNGNQKADDTSFLTRIDTKYFKPKFILHELQTFWGTTCTVVTWGSFYVIGGTIVATERIARKIKNKYNKDHDYDENISSRGTGGRSDSFASYSSSMNESIKSNCSQKHPLKRVSSWTKKSFTSIKKKFNKFVVTSVPQITNSVTIARAK